MVRRIITSYLFAALLFAIMLSLFHVDNVMFGDYFRRALATTSVELTRLNFVIPNIPHIPNDLEFLPLQEVDFWTAVLNFFVNFANVFINFLNGLIDVINFLIQIINWFIQLIEFIVILIKNIFTFRDSLPRA